MPTIRRPRPASHGRAAGRHACGLRPGRSRVARRRPRPGAGRAPVGPRRPSAPAVVPPGRSPDVVRPRRSWRSRSSCSSSRSGVFPLEQAPIVAAALPVVGLLVLLVVVVRARPTLGETALAVDAEGGSGDAVASALAFAGAHPEAAGPTAGPGRRHDRRRRRLRPRRGRGPVRPPPAARRCVAGSGPSSPACSARASPGVPAVAALLAAALVVPAVLLPEPAWTS